MFSFAIPLTLMKTLKLNRKLNIAVFSALLILLNHCQCAPGPFVINTWDFQPATEAAGQELLQNASAVDAIVKGCSQCEVLGVCASSVGWGGSPDENGETTLDAMIMDGETHDVGSVGALRRVKSAIAVAKAVMLYTKHTLLVGDQATDFASEMGFPVEDLHSNVSKQMYDTWRKDSCQPNYRQNVSPNPSKSCGPYRPAGGCEGEKEKHQERYNPDIGYDNHDTIGMIAIDANSRVAAGTSTNGASHKVPGRVGDSPIAGAGAYADRYGGGAASTGDGDVMMRFLPSFHAVQLMRSGMSPEDAARQVLAEIAPYYPSYSGAVVAVNVKGEYGAACHGFPEFPYCVKQGSSPTQVLKVKCTDP